MYTVDGYIDGVSYRAIVDGDQPDPGSGVIGGSPGALALLRTNEGRAFSSTVTGQAVTLDLQDPDTVLPALQALTEVTGTAGDLPQNEEPFDASVIY